MPLLVIARDEFIKIGEGCQLKYRRLCVCMKHEAPISSKTSVVGSGAAIGLPDGCAVAIARMSSSDGVISS